MLSQLLPPSPQLSSAALPLVVVHGEGRLMAVARTGGRLDILRCVSLQDL